MFLRYFKFVHKAFCILFSVRLFLRYCFSLFTNFKVNNSEVEGGFNQVNLISIDLNFWDYNEEQNSVRVLALELEHMLDEAE